MISQPMMNTKLSVICLFAAVMALLSSGCLIRRTVTENGSVVKDNYQIKRPVKDVIHNSRN
ncbi:MAG TPA: hypothetical protein VF258_05270 [Luteolibacter sp.]